MPSLLHRVLGMVAFAASVAACSDDEKTAAVDLKAPTITMVMQMTDGLHVMWDNNQKDCDAVEGERKSGTDAYALVFTTPGSTDNKHDAPLTKGTAYTYRVRCKKGSSYSPYSNEETGTP